MLTNVLYRVENLTSRQGLWYKGDGSFNPHILTLTDGRSKNLPMEFNPEFKIMGLNWYSACDNLEDMEKWFSFQDIVELSKQGYTLNAVEVSQYRNVCGHAAFAEEYVIGRDQLDINRLGTYDVS